MTKALALTTLALAALPVVAPTASAQSAAASEDVYKVSLYGIQRFADVGVEKENPDPDDCWNARGESEATSTVRFHTRKPVRMRVSSHDGRYLSIQELKSDHSFPLRVQADWVHALPVYFRETKSCVQVDKGWMLDPVPLAANCSAQVDWMGFDLVGGTRGSLRAVGGENDTSAPSPFDGCPYGDASMTLYEAKGRVDTRALLDEPVTKVVLRARSRSRSEAPFGGFSETRKKTTVYVTFKKVN